MVINKTHKIAMGIGCGVALIAGVTFGVTTHQANQRKEAERIAYENRAIVEEECIMNGFGAGSCSFTNSGKTAGALCGVIQVDGPGTAYSGKFCSGQVQPQSTTKVEFNIPDVGELCDNGFNPWHKKCDFTFVPDEAKAVPGNAAKKV